MAAFEPGELGRALAPENLPAHVAALLPPAAQCAPAPLLRSPSSAKTASPNAVGARPPSYHFKPDRSTCMLSHVGVPPVEFCLHPFHLQDLGIRDTSATRHERMRAGPQLMLSLTICVLLPIKLQV